MQLGVRNDEAARAGRGRRPQGGDEPLPEDRIRPAVLGDRLDGRQLAHAELEEGAAARQGVQRMSLNRATHGRRRRPSAARRELQRKTTTPARSLTMRRLGPMNLVDLARLMHEPLADGAAAPWRGPMKLSTRSHWHCSACARRVGAEPTATDQQACMNDAFSVCGKSFRTATASRLPGPEHQPHLAACRTAMRASSRQTASPR